MPYINGVRVSNQEWTERFSTIETLHTGPSGANPGIPGDIDDGVPVAKPVKKGRSKRSASAAKAAIADALGQAATSEAVASIDVSGLEQEDE